MSNQKIFLFCIILLMGLSLAVTSAILIADNDKRKSESTAISAVSSGNAGVTDNSAETKTTYLVTAGDGILCVYSCTDGSQILTDAITYIDLYSLDSTTKQSLDSGILFENRIDVIRFIENISS